MSWDEKLFGFFFRRAGQLVRDVPGAHVVLLEPHRVRLELLATSIAGLRVDVRGSDGEGSMRNDGVLSLPERVDRYPSAPENEALLLLQTAFGATALRYGLVLPTLAPGIASREYTESLAPYILHHMLEDLPGTGPMLKTLAAFPAVSPWVLLTGGGRELSPGEASSSKSGSSHDATERRGKNRDAVRRVALREREQENPLTHSFEKTQTAEEYKGGSKTTDADDDMSSHGDALDELDMREVTRSDQQTHSVYRADVLFDADVAHVGDAPPGEGQAVFYDEWDHRAGAYRREFCTVRTSQVTPASHALAAARRARVLSTHREVLHRLTNELGRHFRARAWERNQLEGAEIDLDMLVARHAALRARVQPPERFFMSRTRPAQDLHLAILVDTSLSSDSWVRGQRVIDVAVDALFLLAEVLEPFVVDCQVAAFDSRTRRDCAFRTLKTEMETWQHMRECAVGLVPDGYTRIGPALRHENAYFERKDPGRRLLLVLSDAKPSDYDRYEGRYGVADVQQAIRELRANRTATHLFALDDSHSSAWAEMFGRRGFSAVPDASGIAIGMARALAASLR